MNKIQQMHLDVIQNNKHIRKQLCVNDFGTSDLEKIVASKSAEITEQIAIEFSEWLGNAEFLKLESGNWTKNFGLSEYSGKTLFQEFLKTKNL